MIDGDNSFDLCTLGNFSAISGKSKSGKTLLISAMVASALSSDEVLGKFQGTLPADNPNIIYIDTEMADYDLQWVMKRIIKLSKVNESDTNKLISFYKFREKNTEIRNQLIDVAIRSTPDVGLVIIDGIRDLVMDINNPEESTIAINNIMKWTDMYHVHIITVLHQNPGSQTGNKLRGHIGTEAMNKAEAVISIVKENDASFGTVKSDFMRRESFKSFGLEYDKDTGLPKVIDLDAQPNVNKPDDIESVEHDKVIDKMFSKQDKFTKMDFREKAKVLMLMMGYNISKRNLTKFIDHWIVHKLVKETREGNAKYITRNIPETPSF
jgi:hypothetical protein